MKKPNSIIFWSISITLIIGILYTCYLFYVSDKSEGLIFLPLVFIVFTGLALFIETIIFTIVFYKHLRAIWTMLLGIFLVTSPIPIFLVYNYHAKETVYVPKPSHITVTPASYNTDSKMIIDDFLKNDIDSNGIDKDQDKVQKAFIDTIFYSLDKSKIFAIIIKEVKGRDEIQYCPAYRVGRLVSNKWELSRPNGNIWITYFPSIVDFKNEIRQYYYKSYSINKSSDKPEIWNDNSIFDF